MRNILLSLSMILMICLSANAQVLRMDQVPKAAAKAFRTKYQSAQQESWERIGENTYQVGFFNAKKRQTARFDGAGVWLETETEITMNQLPRQVSNSVNKNFGGFDIQIVNQVEAPDKDITYEVVVFKPKENYDVIFSAKGEILKKEAGAPNE